MAERPVALPEWASTQPPGAIVTPPTTIQEDGWDPLVLPQTEHDNWFKNLVYQWVAWLSQAITGALGLLLVDDRALPGGTPPVVAAGMTLAPGAFSAAAVIGGDAVAVTPSPVINLVATRRYYADLTIDGTWTITDTTLVAGPPAVGADSVRIYVWTTDGAGIDSVTDNRPARAALDGDRLAVEGSIRMGEVRPELTAAIVVPAISDGPEWSLVTATDDARISGEYISTLSGARRMSLIGGRYLGGATPWTADATTMQRTERDNGTLRSWRVSGLTPATAYGNDIFSDTPPVGVTVDFRLDVPGLRHMATSSDPAIAPPAALEIDTTGTTAALVRALTATGVREYVGADVLGQGPGIARATNAQINLATGNWERIGAGDSMLVVQALAGGVRTYYRLAGEASPWAAGDWHLALRTNDQIVGSVPMVAPRVELTTNPGPTIFSHSIYRGNIAKAWGRISSDGAAGVQLDAGHNVAAVAWNGGTGSIDVTLRLPQANLFFVPVPSWLGGAGSNPIRHVQAVPVSANGGVGGGAQFSIQAILLPSGAASDLSAGAAGANPVGFVLMGDQ